MRGPSKSNYNEVNVTHLRFLFRNIIHAGRKIYEASVLAEFNGLGFDISAE